MTDPLIVAIDGPAGSGKSTVARALAERLGLEVLDTGAMYRAVTVLALRDGLDLDDADKVARIAEDAELEMERACSPTTWTSPTSCEPPR